MPLEYPFAIPRVAFELPYATWTTSEAKTKLTRLKKEVISLDFPFLQQKARAATADFAFFHCVSEAILTEEKLRNVQIARLLTEHVAQLQGNPPSSLQIAPALQPQPRSWEASLYGLLNLVEGEIEKEEKCRDLEILLTVVSALPNISNLIWRDLNFLLHDGPVGDHRRCLVSRTIYMVSQLPGQRGKMYDKTTIALVMHCWVYMSPNPIYRLSAAACARYLFFQTEAIPPPPAGVIQTALQSVSIDTFVTREQLALEDPLLLGQHLTMELKALDPFTGHQHEVSQTFVDRKFYIHIINALYRQVVALEDKQKYDEEVITVFTEGDRLITNILQKQTRARPASKLLYDIVANTRAIRVASVGFTLACVTPDFHDSWLLFFTWLLGVAKPTIPPRKGWLFFPIDNILDEIRNALRHIYHNTSIRLVAPDEISFNRYHQLWNELGHVYLIEGHEELTRSFFRSQKRCCNIQCFRAGYEIDHLKKCRKCKDTFYCGRECQKFDWKQHHKDECQRKAVEVDSDDDFLDVMPPKKFSFPAED